jgi:hypothetical protein
MSKFFMSSAFAVLIFVSGFATTAQAQDWVSMAVDQAGHWGWQWDPSYDGARERALDNCGAPGCGTTFTVQARCIGYAESRQDGYWYGVAHGWSHDEVASIAMGRCSRSAPPDTCQLVKDHCQGEQD